MAERVGEGEINGRKTWVYDNGLERYQDTGHIAKPADNTLITAENSTAFHRVRQEKKRAVVAAAANAAVERGDYKRTHGDLAFVAAITEAQYIKATTPDDPKSTDAARFIMDAAGLSEKQLVADDGSQAALQAAAMNAGTALLMKQIMDDVLRVKAASEADVIEGKEIK